MTWSEIILLTLFIITIILTIIDEFFHQQIWNSNMLVDGFIGRAEVIAPINPNYTQVQLPLYGRRKEKTVEKQGHLLVQVYSDDDLTSI